VFIPTQSTWKCRVCGFQEQRELPPGFMPTWVFLHDGGCQLVVILFFLLVAACNIFKSAKPLIWGGVIAGVLIVFMILLSMVERWIQKRWLKTESSKPCPKCGTSGQWGQSTEGGMI
jgi:hypothetical protein